MLEVTVLEWFREWIGMPPGSSGLLTSGGSTANLMAIVAARHRAAVTMRRGSPNSRSTAPIRRTAPSPAQRGSPACRGRISARCRWTRHFDYSWAPFGRRSAPIGRQGLIPCAVVANGGTTNTGAVDPLPELAEFCRDEGLWFHVDSAYGGFAALTAAGRQALDGIGRADSVSLDPHKWLYVPFECGSLLVRDPAALREAFYILPEYMRDIGAAGEEVNFADYGEQLSRYSRALKVWLCVSYYGTEILASEITASMGRATLAEQLVRKLPELELLSPARLGVCCFRAHPAGQDDPGALDALNHRVLERVNANGHFFISTTRIRGALALRICTCGWRTTADDIRRLVEEVRGAAGSERVRSEE